MINMIIDDPFSMAESPYESIGPFCLSFSPPNIIYTDKAL